MIRLFTQTPNLLLEGHVVHFSEGYATGETERFADNYYKVTNPQQISYDRHYILPSADYADIALSNASTGTENLYPHSVDEMYEILFGFSGKSLVYPIIPSPDRHFQKLGYTGMIPDRTNTTLRYLGSYKEHDSPYDEPKLRLTFVKDLDPMLLRTYIDAALDASYPQEKVVFGFLINRCTIVKLGAPTPDQKTKARRILHYTELKKKGGE